MRFNVVATQQRPDVNRGEKEHLRLQMEGLRQREKSKDDGIFVGGLVVMAGVDNWTSPFLMVLQGMLMVRGFPGFNHVRL